MSYLFVSTGRKKLKLHDSAVMFEQGVWFSILIMLPRARPPPPPQPPDTEITIRFLVPSVDSQVDSHTNRHIHKHRCCNAPAHKNTHKGGQIQKVDLHTGFLSLNTHTHTHTLPRSSLNDLSALIWEKWFPVMKQTEKMIFLFISGQSRPWPFSSW